MQNLPTSRRPILRRSAVERSAIERSAIERSAIERSAIERSAIRALLAAVTLGAVAALTGATCLPGADGGEDAGVVEPEPAPSEPTPPVDAGPPDEEGPVVEFVAPQDRCLSGSVTFEFTAVDDGVGTGFVSAQFAGVALDLVEGVDDRYTAVVDTSGLFVGLKDLVVIAVDVRNNTSETRHTYAVSDGETYLEHTDFTCGTPPDPPPDDVDPPTVAVISPIAEFDVYERETFTMTVRATDDVGPVTVRARVGANEIILDAGHIDERLVERKRFNGVRKSSKDLHQLFADLRRPAPSFCHFHIYRNQSPGRAAKRDRVLGHAAVAFANSASRLGCSASREPSLLHRLDPSKSLFC